MTQPTAFDRTANFNDAERPFSDRLLLLIARRPEWILLLVLAAQRGLPRLVSTRLVSQPEVRPELEEKEL